VRRGFFQRDVAYSEARQKLVFDGLHLFRGRLAVRPRGPDRRCWRPARSFPGSNLDWLSLVATLLHVSWHRVVRTGRIRDGFIGMRKASVLGSIAAGTWLVVWPARLVSGFWKDAEIIAPGSSISTLWHVGLILVTALTLLHIAWACLRGGKLRHFLWPQPRRFLRWLKAPGKFAGLQGLITDYVLDLRLPFYFWLGLRGFVGALAWLILPVGILLAATRAPLGGSILLSLLGGFLLLLVAIHLPFLQAHFAQTDRFSALFELREVRRLFLRAPLAFWFALLITLLFAVPLYLLKIELTPRELAWLPSLLFVIFIFPARILTGWAMSRALRHEQPRALVPALARTPRHRAHRTRLHPGGLFHALSLVERRHEPARTARLPRARALDGSVRKTPADRIRACSSFVIRHSSSQE
jgi:hypothetical protein